MKHKKFKRCFTKRIVTDRAIVTCRYNVNHSLIATYPEIPARLMSLYRGTSPAALWDLAADLDGYVEEPS
jgi:hypothetical protein